MSVTGAPSPPPVRSREQHSDAAAPATLLVPRSLTTSIAQRATSFFREHLSESITVADAADAVGYSQFHFTRLFTGAAGVSPGRYLTAARFERAKQLLLTESFCVRDICHQVGFTSPATFTRRFTADVNVAPAALRRLADRISDTSIDSFSLPGPLGGPTIRGRVRLPEQFRGALGDRPPIWIGTFHRPTPAGRPATGTLLRGEGNFELPLADAPWLLAAAMPGNAGPLEQLGAGTPLVAVHPVPLTGPARVDLELAPAAPWSFPLLTALPSLYFERI